MKVLTIHLGGKDRTLDVGKFYFTKYLGEIIGSDPLNAKVDQFTWVVGIVYAGMRTEYKVNNRAVDFSKDDVEGWIGQLEIGAVADIINRYVEVSNGETPGEGQAPEAQ